MNVHLKLGATNLALAATLVAANAASSIALASFYTETDLVSDLPGRAAVQDVNLANPWGISFGPGGPFWISDNHTGKSTLYRADGSIVPLVVTVPPPLTAPGTTAAPTGQVFSGTSGFQLPGPPAGPPVASVFTFATEDGTISGWNPALGNTAILRVDNSAKGLGSVYKGLAIGQVNAVNQLYAADFSNGAVDVFDTQFAPVSLGSGAFTDPNLPAGYAPFNIANVGGMLITTYALQDPAKHDDVRGAGNGYVDIYNPDGTLVKRLISGGALDSPWGVALAPATFGQFANDLLIGNFGDGTINAFDPITGTLEGTLRDLAGDPISIDGLWGLAFRPDLAGQQSKLFFTAGINGEANGLFGALAVPEPSMLALLAISLLPLIWFRRPKSLSYVTGACPV